MSGSTRTRILRIKRIFADWLMEGGNEASGITQFAEGEQNVARCAYQPTKPNTAPGWTPPSESFLTAAPSRKCGNLQKSPERGKPPCPAGSRTYCPPKHLRPAVAKSRSRKPFRISDEVRQILSQKHPQSIFKTSRTSSA